VADRPATSAGGTDFDDWKDFYSEAIERAVPFLPESHDFFVRTKAEELLELVEDRLGRPEEMRLLDVGCGIGLVHRHMAGRAGRLEGADIAEGSIERARASNPEVVYHLYDGRRLPHETGAVDVTYSMGVVHHIRPPEWGGFMAELVRVTRPGGLVALVEPNMVNPVCRLAAPRCEFDKDANFLRAAALRRIARQAGLKDVAVRYILFVPFRMPHRRAVERRLRWLPLGAQYIVAGRVTGSATGLDGGAAL
jgi:SAM-dependent methyltransferase